MLVPNSAHAFVDPRKLADYCLDLTHPIGRHKAAIFRRVLGFTEEDVEMLVEILLRAVAVREASLGRLDEFGQRYAMDFPVATPTGSAMLRAAWIIRPEEDFPV